ncbi:MAG: DNA-binding protein [Lachnospiraceae bacterium]|nr:DNA-binding protein [Lachnospiraceae bacterium]
MEKIVQQTLFFDFYGELLTEHQQKIYEDVVCNDMSCSEVAAEQGVSRQGIHDLIKRCNRQLEEYEEKLHLVERFLDIQSKVRRIRQIASETAKGSRALDIQEMIQISDEILEEL